MEATICVLFIVALWGITFLYTAVKEMKPSRIRAASGDLNYLYTYRSVLQKVAQIEIELQNIDSHPYFRSVEISLIRQQTFAKMRALIADYGRGQLTGADAHARLDEIGARIRVVFYSIAA
jgi:hypothetical protein